MNKSTFNQLFGLIAAALLANGAHAQLTVAENFNSATLSGNNTWQALNGACLTASTANTSFSTSSPVPVGVIPGCVSSGGSANSYYSGKSSTLVGGATGNALPDTAGNGALRLTNGASSGMSSTNGNNETGAIVLANAFPSNEGLNITFNTFTWGGNGYGNNTGAASGADGMSFFLVDASYYPSSNGVYTINRVGTYGGSLGYDCASNKYASATDNGGDGLRGAYLGLGIDEYGNFVNKGDNGKGNEVLSPGPLPNTVAVRGRGDIAYQRFPLDSNGNPTGINPAANGFSGAVYTAQGVCGAGYYTAKPTATPTVVNVDNASSIPSSSTTSTSTAITVTTISNSGGSGNDKYYTATTTVYPKVNVYDYGLMAYKQISPSTVGNIYNQEKVSKPQRNPITGVANTGAIPINYNINLTATGLLTVSYSYNGGSYTPVIANQSILTSNGSIPDNFLFGFASGTGGGSNNHEITCFKAVQLQSSSSSAGGNIPQNTHVIQGNQIYLASYNPLYWTGTVTATELNVNNTTGIVTIQPTSVWDAGCTLTGSTSCQNTGNTTVIRQPIRAVATWNDGIAAGATTATSGAAGAVALTVGTFSNLSGNQQQLLNCGDPSTTASTCDALGSARVGFMIDGNTASNDTVPANTFRSRYSLLGDMINSSPVWEGAPTLPYTNSWVDKLNTTATQPEQTSYLAYQTYVAGLNNGSGRLNTVYVGANDGMVHGFAAGYGDVVSNSTDNTGTEIMAFAPSLPLSDIHNLVYGTGELDFTGLLYAHNDFVDATPGVGDLYWGGATGSNGWQTWLVGGLGGGGNLNGVIGGNIDASNGTILTATANNGLGEIYAINITNPIVPGALSTNSGATVAANVMGDWTTNSIVCDTVTGATDVCNNHMGSTYGTPEIRRLHSGNWGIIFGNGLNSAQGTAGIFVIEVTGSGPKPTYIIHYMDTGAGPSSDPTGKGTVNGIAFVSPADLDGDHITDYVYAGDVLGNIWRFDLTSGSAGNWGSPVKIFNASSSALLQPITTSLIVATIPYLGKNGVVVNFGTGREIQQTLNSLAGYAPNGQILYGVWDWQLTAWNALSTTQYWAQTTGITSGLSNLTAQTLSKNKVTLSGGLTDGYTVSANVVCYPFMTNCNTSGTSYGWYIGLSNTQEQFIYNPTIEDGVIFINSVIPPDQQVQSTTCTTPTATGYTYSVNADTGSFSGEAAVNINGVGTPYFVSTQDATGNNIITMITQTQSGRAYAQQVSPCQGVNCVTGTSSRLTWLELR